MYEKICVVRKKSTKSGVQKSAKNISGGKSGNSPYHHSSSVLRRGKFKKNCLYFSLADVIPFFANDDIGDLRWAQVLWQEMHSVCRTRLTFLRGGVQLCRNFLTIYGGRNWVGIGNRPARLHSLGGIGSLESILGLLKWIKIWAQINKEYQTNYLFPLKVTLTLPRSPPDQVFWTKREI